MDATSVVGGSTQEGTDRSDRRAKLAWLGVIAYLPVAWLLWPNFPDVLDPIGSEGRTPGRFIELCIAGLWVVAGFVVQRHRPERRIGLLMMLNGWLLTSLALVFGASGPVSFTAGILLFPLSWPLWHYLVLSYPDGRLHSRPERFLVGAEVFSALFFGYLHRLFWEPPSFTGWKGLNLVLVWDRPDVVVRYFDTFGYVYGALHLFLLIGIFVARLRKARGFALRIAAPLAIPVILFGATDGFFLTWLSRVHIEQVFLGGNPMYNFETPFFVALRSIKEIGLFLVPVGILTGLELSRRRRQRLLRLVTEFGNEEQEGELEDALRRAMKDPSLRVVYPSSTGPGYVDERGDSVSEPPADDPRLTMTPLRADGVLLAGVIHDNALASDPRFVQALTAATRLAVARRRLAQEMRKRTISGDTPETDVHEAVEAERHRIGRDLHDGAQQRLANLSLLLNMTESTRDSPEAEARMRLLREEIDAAILDVRQLARGLAPPSLEHGGLRAGLKALMQGSSLVRLHSVPDRSWSPEIERVAYFVASESIANALKHANPTQITVGVTERDGALAITITDDGCGGADPGGNGLSGLAERVSSLGGSFDVDSTSNGTVVQATLPASPVPSREGALLPSEPAR